MNDISGKPSSSQRPISEFAAAPHGAFGQGNFSRPGQAPLSVVPPKLYRIGEIVEHVGISRQTVHNYAIMGLLHEARWTAGGHRLFDEGVFQRLRTIAEMKARNKSLQDIREYFERLDADPQT